MTTTPITPLDGKNVHAVYDSRLKILRVSYSGILDPEVTNQFYGWLIPIIQSNPHLVTEARGSIYDFREVTEFASTNVSTARQKSKIAVQQNMELKRHPVALLVANKMQERMVSVMMVLTKDSDRKKLVYSLEEAENYIRNWHLQHAEELSMS